MALDGLPQIADAALPAAVRTGSAEDKRTYKAALGFEQVMLGELVREMTAGTPALSEGPRADAVNDAMTEALTGAGGIGLARQLFATLQQVRP
jgi:2C-methyl-D-erythritol 2,4-cyclodiphosphate synthase